MEERVNTGGMKTFVSRDRVQEDVELSRAIDEGYRKYDERKRRERKRIVITTVIIILILALGLFGCLYFF
jgi:hypothetical protein